jgi:Holliday junction DNA helicase RuvA
MYAFIEGEIIEKSELQVILKPDGMGLGFIVNVPPRTIAELPLPGSTARLYTSFQVREDSQTRYGFETPAERDLFEALLKISGIGGKIALAILDLPRDRIVAAIASGDADALRAVNGVGPKTAGRIVLELKDRFAQELMAEWAGSGGGGGLQPRYVDMPDSDARQFAEAVEALVELGYQRPDARDRIRHARLSLGDSASAEDLVRHGLTH